MVTATYIFLVAAVGLQRVLEVRVSQLNEAELKAQGGREHASEQMPVMKALHTAWLVACVLEVWLLDRPFYGWLALLALLVFCAGQALRWAAMRALGPRWTVKVITVPGKPPVTRGVFRYLRHPNYLGVMLEIAALPLMHSAYLTAIVFSTANGLLLWRRVLAEESALAEGSDYQERFRHRPRFLPRLGYVPTLPDDSSVAPVRNDSGASPRDPS